jgi:HD-like signal output (HDOD) protein
MSKQRFNYLIQKIESFPTLPSVVSQVMEITSNPDSSANDLLAVITPDQSLTTTILRLANSAFFGLSREVSTLQQALNILGFAEVRNLVLSKAVFNSFQDFKKGSGFDISKFWQHSFITGLAAKILAAELRGASNEFFVAGLIHDIGRLLMYMTMKEDLAKSYDKADDLAFNLHLVEKEIIGISHDQAGMMLLKRWMFPKNLLIAVGYHHCPDEAEEQQLFPFVVHVADLLAHACEARHNDVDLSALLTEVMGPEFHKLCEKHGLEWSEVAWEKYLDQLDNLLEEESGTLQLLIS